MPDLLDDRLAGLATGPLPPIRSAAEVRHRGDRRRRKASALVVSTVVVALLAGAGAAYTVLSDRARTDELLLPARTASAAPSGATTLDRAPKTTAQPSLQGWQTHKAYLSPEDASLAEQPGWAVAGHEPAPGPLLDPCGEGGFPQAARVQDSGERRMRSQRGERGSELRQEVFRYSSAESAQAAFAEYADRIRRCPSRPEPPNGSGYTRRFEIVEEAGGDQLLVRAPSCNPACTGLYVQYLMVVRSADGLSALAYETVEDGDPADGARGLLRAAARTLAGAVRG